MRSPSAAAGTAAVPFDVSTRFLGGAVKALSRSRRQGRRSAAINLHPDLAELERRELLTWGYEPKGDDGQPKKVRASRAYITQAGLDAVAAGSSRAPRSSGYTYQAGGDMNVHEGRGDLNVLTSHGPMAFARHDVIGANNRTELLGQHDTLVDQIVSYAPPTNQAYASSLAQDMKLAAARSDRSLWESAQGILQRMTEGAMGNGLWETAKAVAKSLL